MPTTTLTRDERGRGFSLGPSRETVGASEKEDWIRTGQPAGARVAGARQCCPLSEPYKIKFASERRRVLLTPFLRVAFRTRYPGSV